MSDLYEVCGQAEKSVLWKQDAIKIIERMIYRENSRMKKGQISRFEIGDMRQLCILKNKLKMYPAKLKIFIVQPGIDSSKVTKEMNQVLCGTRSYLMETYGIELGVICS